MSDTRPPTPAPSFSGTSAPIASVVRMFLAIDAAFCRAERVTIAASMMPSSDELGDLVARCVQAVAFLRRPDFVDHHGALQPAVPSQLARRPVAGPRDERVPGATSVR